MKNPIPSGKQVDRFNIQQTRLPATQSLEGLEVGNLLRWEYFPSSPPSILAFFAGCGGKEDLEMQRPICEDFREQDLDISILGVSLCSDISSSCFWY